MSSTYSYTPSSLVKYVHNIPHLNNNLQLSSNSFYVTQNSPWNQYTESLLTLPIIIGCIGYTAVITLALTFCFRCCCNLCKTTPKDVDFDKANIRSIVNWAGQVSKQRSKLSREFFYFCMFIVIADQFLFLGNYHLSKGISKADTAIDFVYGLSAGSHDAALVLQANAESFQQNMKSGAANCEYLEMYENVVDQYMEYIDTYSGIVEPIPNKIESFQSSFDEYAYEKKNASLWTLYTLVICIVTMYSLGVGLQAKRFLNLAITLSICLMLAFIVICCLEMALLIGLADFCIDPTGYAIQAVANENTQEVAGYYSTCQGEDPLYVYVNTAYNAFLDLNASLPSIQQLCEGNGYIPDMIQNSNNMLNSIIKIKSHSECDNIKDQWENVFNAALCKDGFQGFFTLWIVQFILIFFLFLLTSTVSMLYQYFGDLWTIDREEILIASLEENDPFRNNSSQHSNHSDSGHPANNPMHRSGAQSLEHIRKSFSGRSATMRSGSGRVPDVQYNNIYKSSSESMDVEKSAAI